MIKIGLRNFHKTLLAILLMLLILPPISHLDNQPNLKLKQLSDLADGEITTIVGRVLGDKSPATEAKLIPTKILLDANRNLIVIDNEHSRIRKIDAKTGVIDTIAGNGNFNPVWTMLNGVKPTEVSFNQIQDIVMDKDGNIFIAELRIDYNSNPTNYFGRILKLDIATKQISIVAGDGKPQDGLGDNDIATKARFYPYSIALDPEDNLFIADGFHETIRRIDKKTNIITTIAGNGESGDCTPDGLAMAIGISPYNLAIDKNGNIFFTQLSDHLVRRLDKVTSMITTIVAADDCRPGFSGDGNLATKATLDTPISITLDKAGNLFIADRNNMRIRKVDASSQIITTVVGDGYKDRIPFDGDTYLVGRFRGDGKTATQASLYFPENVAIDENGNLFIADTYNYCIRRVDAITNIITTIAGKGNTIKPFQIEPDAILATDTILDICSFTIDSQGNIYLAECDWPNKIKIIDANTKLLKTISGQGPTTSNGTGGFSGDGGLAINAELNAPSDVKLDSLGNIFIADSRNSRIRKININTKIINTIAGNGKYSNYVEGRPAKKTSLDYPTTLTIDQNRNLLLIDQGNNHICKIDNKTKIITTIAGNGQQGYDGDGKPATETSLDNPLDIALDRQGNIFIAENQRVRRIDAISGIITTVAGGGDIEKGIGDGLLATEVAIMPSAIAIDPLGNLFISDKLHNLVRKIDGQTGIITTIAGNGDSGYSGDNGLATKASLFNPRKLVIDNGNLFIMAYPGIRVVKGIIKSN